MAEFLKQRGVVDNVVNYRLFPQIPTSVNEENTEKYLQEQLESYLVFLSDLLVDYIWQHESFRLGVIPASGMHKLSKIFCVLSMHKLASGIMLHSDGNSRVVRTTCEYSGQF